MDATLGYKDIRQFIALLMDDYAVVAPTLKEDRYSFEALSDPLDAVVKYNTTILPPVKWLYPNNEVFLRFDLKDLSKTKTVINADKQALLFLHPCDINAINIMDEILAEEPADLNYLARRRETVIVGYECFGPCRDNILCFDKGYNIAFRGFDLMFADIYDRFYVRAVTGLGNDIVENYGVFKKVTYDDRVALTLAREEGGRGFKKTFCSDIDNLSHLLKESYADIIWEQEGKKCLSCGACNIVCPTCYCFDVLDDVSLDMEEGCRRRRWDGCQLSGFCKIASGENFRDTAAARVRHRIFKKEVYLKKRYGRSGCVGCGRCIDSCIANISIIDIYNKLSQRSSN